MACATLPDIFNVQGIKTKVVFFDSDDDINIKSFDIKREPSQDLDEKEENDPDIEVKKTTGKDQSVGEYLSNTLYANTNIPLDLPSLPNISLIKTNLRCDSETKSKAKIFNEKKRETKNRNNKKNKSKKHYKDDAFISKGCNDNSLIHNRKTITTADERNENTKSTKDFIIKKRAEFHQKNIEPGKKLLKNTKFSENQKNKTVKLVSLYKKVSIPTFQLNSAKPNISCSMPIIPDDQNENELKIKTHIDQDNVEDLIPSNKIEVNFRTKPLTKIKSFCFDKGPECQKIRISYPISKPSHESVENKTLKNMENILKNLTDKNKVKPNIKNDEEMNWDVNICFDDSKSSNNLSTVNVLPRTIQNYEPSSNDVTITNYGQEKDHNSYVRHVPNNLNISTNNVQHMQQKKDSNNLQGTVPPSILYRSINEKDINSNPIPGDTVKRCKNYKYKTLGKPKKKTSKLRKDLKSTEPDQIHNITLQPNSSIIQQTFETKYEQHVMEVLRLRNNIMHADINQTNTLTQPQARENLELNHQYSMNQPKIMPISGSNKNVLYPNQINSIQTNSLLSKKPKSVPNLYPIKIHQQTLRVPDPNVNILDPGTNPRNYMYIQPNLTPMKSPPQYNKYPDHLAMMKNMTEGIRSTSVNLPQNNLWGNANMVWSQPQYSYPTPVVSTTLPRRSMSRDSGCFSPPDCSDFHAMALQTPTYNDNESSKNMSIAADTVCIVCKARTKSSCLACRGSYYCSTKCQYMDWDNHKYQCNGPVNQYKQARHMTVGD